tara:strand:+ start:498 stop:794 length:297 start_codon:yes stop_codon:yes gene_type:complete
VTVTTVKAAIALMHEPEIDSLWEYEDAFGQPLWAAFIHGQYCDIYFGSCTALKHDGEITGMGREFLEAHKERKEVEEIEYPVSTETKRWWQGKREEAR